ncbi:DEAD/DEAH box helicase [Carbonactinospora thermoautotrophica]|uniref:DEAD/DEAH box helicase n=1 Tax=Carbonactinospora thermoautotrophica TaxID=1469144 RepID=A0A132NGT7_9ACTN|nr:DEAD/DEAH box helicase [Carbonactinospora thermoautotrophica]KWW97648.1 DEAD/DEAH box helicase [Carbonactinospora thermoautotrophica]KWX08902.1 DEAD/DEAH box helicase [Carbonactinospora thermoautotrophica]
MDVFEIRDRLIEDYKSFTTASVVIRDERIQSFVQEELARGRQWPDPWLSLNPNFASGGSITDLVAEGLLHPRCEQIFRVKQGEDDLGARPITLYKHQRDAVEVARGGESYVLTTGTGSGKSLSYIVPIVDRVLREKEAGDTAHRIRAIIVYPMNALANSQLGELEKFLTYGFGRGNEPVTYARYTGQEGDAERDEILRRKPDILLTNYVMLEYLLIRPRERRELIRAAQGLRFLVFDELHTYRGRQGADVALLIRRVREACDSPDLQCVGTSATMSSEGGLAERRAKVAEVASRIFGTEVTPDRVIGETLVRATADLDPTPEQLAAAIDRAIDGGRTRDYAELLTDPLACWIETTFGLTTEEGVLVRQRPTKVPDAAERLAKDTGVPVERCVEAIKAVLHAGSRAKHPETGRPLFAFRLHQFLSKGDTVYLSLEPEDVRFITDQYQQVVPGQPDKVLLPAAFCRECGQEYLVVAKVSRGGRTVYEPRQERDASGGDSANGYLYISSAAPWPVDRIQAVREGRVPDSWVAPNSDGTPDVVPSKQKYLPRQVHVALDGTEVGPGEGLEAAFVPAPFTFCLRCRVSYEQTRGQDFAKLATLDAEGRSSAMSVISASIVRSLQTAEVDEEARKLLTFVDNRQDASLQAGHFNDFVQVTHLRGAVYRAALEAGEEGLRYEDAARKVAEALELPFETFAQNPGARFAQRETTLRALREVVDYRLFLDLERGWRVTMPNLEQTGLLRFGYVSLAEIAEAEDVWEHTHPALRDAPAEARFQVGHILLDEMRRALAVDAECLTLAGFERIQRLSDQYLTGPWALPENSVPPRVATVFPAPSRPGRSRADVHLTGRSLFGRYLRRPTTFPHAREVKVEDAQKIISDLLKVFEECGLLITAVDPKQNKGVPGYRLKAGALIWRAGDGREGSPDPLRKQFDPELGARVNPFFVRLYRETAHTLAGLHAAEHTAQVPAPLREQREDRFRRGELPLLYCSPTMELGVDISTLNAVAMRNVPPTPANYAQRSGRAGRSGQQALVTTYCATGNPHDQYYFRRSDQMVAGSVAAPRIDLANEDLVRSHVHAIWLAETGQDLGSALPEVLNLAAPDLALPIHEDLHRALHDPEAIRRATERARRVLAEVRAELEQAPWWYEGWIEDTVRDAPHAFDRACDRWRQLYRNAYAEQEEQNRRVLDQSTSPDARRRAERRRREAENQLKLLRNEEGERGFSDFYSYRYFASEGFLPGYAFPRLPLAAYIPGARRVRGAGSEGDYLQRPRFLAISEFGPGALIYHEGARYEVKRVQLATAETEPGEVATEESRICESCGYFHHREAGADLCPNCGASFALGTAIPNLMRLSTVFTERRERISSDEEERRRAGFELRTVYRFTQHGARPGRLDAEAVDADGGKLADLVYGDTAVVRVINLGRRRRKDRESIGYWLDTVTGRWLSEKQATDRTPEDEALDAAEDVQTRRKVVPFVEDHRNILVVRLADQVDETTATTLRYALERGIEAAFQLEDAELASLPLPDPDERGRMLLMEAAEGGAGVLRRLQGDPHELARVAREALRIIHYDPDTGQDLDRAPGARDRCELGCYDCLLSYGNQLEHRLIDRHRAVEWLRRLAGATVRGTAAGADQQTLLAELSAACDSELERKFLALLAERGHRLPDAAQQLVDDLMVRPDFVYRLPEALVAVFVDGPHHDAAHQWQRDLAAEDRLVDAGWLVVRFRYDDDWSEILRRYPNVFGPGRGGNR